MKITKFETWQICTTPEKDFFKFTEMQKRCNRIFLIKLSMKNLHEYNCVFTLEFLMYRM